MSTTESTRVTSAERLLAFTAVGVAVVAFACLIAVLAAPLVGVRGEALQSPVWQGVFLVGYLGLPLAFVFVFALLITRIVHSRRTRPRD